MITTRFLLTREYEKFETWLKNLDKESRDTYFGIPVTDAFIEELVQRIMDNPAQHEFLVAEDANKIVGIVHIARVSDTEVEFGISVDKMVRSAGLGDLLLKEAMLWARNRGYEKLYLHCLTRNERMRKLAEKNGLTLHKEYDEYDACTTLPPASFMSIGKEIAKTQRDIFVAMLSVPFITSDIAE